LVNNAKEDIMRISAWLALDCVIPLGPHYLGMMMDGIKQISTSDLSGNSMFQSLKQYLPGNSDDDRKALLHANLDASGQFLTDFAQSKEMTQQSMFDKVRHYVEISEDKLDYVGAILDMTVHYFGHTGVQTAARRLVVRAYNEL